MLVAQQVVDVQTLDAKHFDLRQIARGTLDLRIRLGNDDQRALDFELRQSLDHDLGLGVFKVKLIHNNNLAVATLKAERRKQSLAPRRARHTVGVISWLRAEHGAAADPDRRANAAGPRTSRAFLAPRFFAAAADESLGFRRRAAGAAIGKLHDHRLMQQVRARLGTEDRLVKRRLYDVNFHCPYLLIAGRRMTTPRFAPGTAPRTSSKFSSARISTTSRFCVETCSLPQWPAIFLPLRTRPG